MLYNLDRSKQVKSFSNRINVLRIDGQNDVFIGTPGTLYILRPDHETLVQIKSIYNFNGGEDNNFAFDSENNVYLHDVHDYTNKAIYTITKEELAKPNPMPLEMYGVLNSQRHFKGLFVVGIHQIYVTTTSGLIKVNRGQVQVIEKAYTKLLTVDHEKNVYYSTFYADSNALYKRTSNGIITKIVDQFIIWKMVVDQNNNFYFYAIRKGLFLLKYGSSYVTQIKYIYPLDIMDYIKWMVVDRKSNLYIFTYINSFYRLYFLEENSIKSIEILTDYVTSISIDHNVFIGTSYGVFQHSK